MTWFSSNRLENFPSQFPENKTPVTVDVLDAGLILAFVIVAFCFFLTLSGNVGIQRVWIGVRVTCSLFIGCALIVCNFGQEWEVGHTYGTNLPYKAGSTDSVNATIGVRFGLRSLNITMKADQNPEGEIVNYNERFTWTWDQGRNGFGPFAGRYNREYRDAQRRGLPFPILWVAEYLTFDGDGIRWGRHYRTAGWFAHIMMWSAFALWLLCNILFFMVIQYAAYCLLMMGGAMIIANIIWATVRNHVELSILIADEDALLKTHFGVHFWITLIIGLLCLILGVIIMVMDLIYPDETAVFFGIDPLANYEEYHLTAEELEQEETKDQARTSSGRRKTQGNTMEMGLIEMQADVAVSSEDSLPRSSHRLVLPTAPQTDYVVLKRRTTSRFAQKSFIRKPAVPPRRLAPSPPEEDQPLYENIPARSEDSELMYENMPSTSGRT